LVPQPPKPPCSHLISTSPIYSIAVSQPAHSIAVSQPAYLIQAAHLIAASRPALFDPACSFDRCLPACFIRSSPLHSIAVSRPASFDPACSFGRCLQARVSTHSHLGRVPPMLILPCLLRFATVVGNGELLPSFRISGQHHWITRTSQR
jgi:hypothetical protein